MDARRCENSKIIEKCMELIMIDAIFPMNKISLEVKDWLEMDRGPTLLSRNSLMLLAAFPGAVWPTTIHNNTHHVSECI